MELIQDNTITTIHFTEDQSVRDKVEEFLYDNLAAEVPGAQFSPQVKRGFWDGMVHFYDKKEHTFATGLTKDVTTLLEKVRFTYEFTFEVVDNRPDRFISPEDIPEEVHIGDLTLYNYQANAVRAVFESGYGGLVNIATGGGKCYTADTRLLTNEGYKTIAQIIVKSSRENTAVGDYIKPYSGLKIVNRYGDLETPSVATFNGKRPILEIETNSGLKEKVTHNHPLLVIRGGKQEWVKAGSLTTDDFLVTRSATNVFGNLKLDKDTAYALGAIIADGYLGSRDYISFTTGAHEVANSVFAFFNGIKPVSEPKWDDKNHLWELKLFGREFVSRLHVEYDLCYGVAKDKYIPSCILAADRETQLAFLSGYLECEMSYDSEKNKTEVTSASEVLISQIALMLRNLGVYTSLHDKVVPKYPENYYGRISIARNGTETLLPLLEFVSPQRKAQVKESHNYSIEHPQKQEANHFLPTPNLVLSNYYKETTKYYKNTSNDRRKYFSAANGKRLGMKQIRSGMEKYPVASECYDELKEMVKPEYRYEKISSIKSLPPTDTYDIAMPKTHSFIAEGIVNHNTAVGASIINMVLSKLQRGERVAFFTNNKEIFRQNIENLNKFLPEKVGYLGGGKKKMARVMVCMIPTVDSYLKIDPEAGLKFSPKEQQVKKMAKTYAPQFIYEEHPYQAFKSFVSLFKPIKKVDYTTQETLEDIRDSCGSDKDVVNTFNKYIMQYDKLVEKKASDSVKKKKFITDLLDSFVLVVADEVHHTKADTWYRTLLACRNAIYRVGLSGSIDKEDPVMWTRLRGIFGGIVAKVGSKELVDRGILAKPTIVMIPINEPSTLAAVSTKGNGWQKIYKLGIEENEYRNTLIAGITKKQYEAGKSTLIIVNRINQADIIGAYLDALTIPHEFINGQQDDEERKSELARVASGENRVLLSTSVLDEGVDISNIDTLILAAGGKSMRQVIQRIGRALRKKKNKENKATIFDFEDNENQALRKHTKERLAIYQEQEFEVKYVGR